MDSGTASAIGSAGTGVINGILGYIGQTQTNDMNRDLAHDARIYNEQMWNKQNEYNSYANQMKRMIEAGLNPRLMYGQASSSNAGSVPAAPIAHVENALKNIQLPDVLTILDKYQDYRLKGAQVDNIETWKYIQESRRFQSDQEAIASRYNKDLLERKSRFSDILFSEDNIYKIAQYQMDAAKLATELQSAEIFKKQQEGKSAQTEAEVNEQYKSTGVNQADELYQRIIAKILYNMGVNF